MLIEGVLTLVIVVLFLVFIGIPLDTILTVGGTGILIVTALAAILFSLFFIVTLCSLPFFRLAKGTFLRFSDDLRFDRAVYDVDGTEYTCIFPAESFGRRMIYKQGERKLLISRSGKRHYAYDRHSLLIIAIGTVTSAGFITLLLLLLNAMWQLEFF